ncbi:Lipocalin-like domain-containing protein [Hypoxylon trugodes]|uniref:Lipocalin-like domain-containing protein n=1 Tax=Hypoxylon trugodes TaxID=326681 RepID=UPI00218ED022|nr:Lipocalin-like domain-containing protein [Hypoxylon trugodes]KAI1390774.1 Lipocalin-like domain-containing protein [Hypoxylon trugodes]
MLPGTLFALAFAASTSQATPLTKPEDVVKAITGTWLYLNVTSYYDNGTISRHEEASLGRYPVGLLNYNAQGFMSANFMSARPEDRPPGVDTEKIEIGTDAEWSLIGKHTLSYSGPWYVSETTKDVEVGQITHGPTRVAWLPSWVGKELVKNYTLLEDGTIMRLRSKNDEGINGDMFFTRLAGGD